MEHFEPYKGVIPDIYAKMYIVPSENGGRDRPFTATGYYYLGFERIEPQYSRHEVTVFFSNKEKGLCFGGELVDIYIYFYCAGFQIGNLFEGLNFYLKEGGRVIATATITKVLKPEMVYWHPETLLNSLREKGLKSLSEAIKTNLRREFSKIAYSSNIAYSNPNKDKKAIFDVNLTGFYNDLTNLGQVFAIWQEKFNLGEEKHKYYYIDKDKSRQVIFEFVTWNDKNYLSCCLVLQA
jgi:hypothetical protein